MLCALSAATALLPQTTSALTMGKLETNSPMRKAIAQIKAHVAKHNAEPERFESK